MNLKFCKCGNFIDKALDLRTFSRLVVPENRQKGILGFTKIMGGVQNE